MIRLTSITRGYATIADRDRAIAQLRRRGYDHFVRYRDTHAPVALCFGRYERPARASGAPDEKGVGEQHG